MKKIILILAVLSGTVMADYIPDRRDRNMENLCRAIVSNQLDTYKAEDGIYYFGVMDGVIDMAIFAHVINKEGTSNRSMSDINHYVCRKTLQDKNVNDFGFRKVFINHAYKATRK